MKRNIIFAILILIGTVSAAVYHFTIKGDIEVEMGEVKISPQSFTAEVRCGAAYVKRITIENYGASKNIYFEAIVEGPSPDKVSVKVHDVYGNAITSSNKLILPEGTEDNPGTVEVNVHVSVEDDASSGKYTVYIMAKET